MSTASFVFTALEKFFLCTREDLEIEGKPRTLPRFERNVLIDLCDEAIGVLQGSPQIPEIDGNVMIVGDIHGNFLDFVRIIQEYRQKEPEHIVFLGDYVDRGNLSIEVISGLLAFAVLNPEKVTLLRGNHEFRTVNESYGFKDEINEVYQETELYDKFNEVFSWLPLCAIVNQKVFCVHGGICPEFLDIGQVRNVPRPLQTYDDPIVYGMMWADPAVNLKDFSTSKRGAIAFGERAARKWLLRNNMSFLVRGHEMAPMGIAQFCFGHVVTVFSSSNYGGDKMMNKCGYLICDPDIQFRAHAMAAHPQWKRADMRFIPLQRSDRRLSSCHAVITKLGRSPNGNKSSMPSLMLLPSSLISDDRRMRFPAGINIGLDRQGLTSRLPPLRSISMCTGRKKPLAPGINVR